MAMLACSHPRYSAGEPSMPPHCALHSGSDLCQQVNTTTQHHEESGHGQLRARGHPQPNLRATQFGHCVHTHPTSRPRSHQEGLAGNSEVLPKLVNKCAVVRGDACTGGQSFQEVLGRAARCPRPRQPLHPPRWPYPPPRHTPDMATARDHDKTPKAMDGQTRSVYLAI